ncbi:hypothetical protein PIROE2DRAFT_7573, partial [Piromyces sp. E2]
MLLTINNEKELTDNLKKVSKDDLIINLNKGSVDILNKIEIKNDYKSLSIIGLSKELSILKINNETSSLIFNSSIPQIKIENISIEGYLNFKKYSNIQFSNVILNGNLDIENGKKGNGVIKFDHFEFHSLLKFNSTKHNCIELYGKVIINESNFYGSPQCKDSIINYNGNEYDSFEVTKSYFDGVYSNNCLSFIKSNFTHIESSIFERGSSIENENGG